MYKWVIYQKNTHRLMITLWKVNFQYRWLQINLFKRIPFTQTLDIGINRDTKTAGGTTRYYDSKSKPGNRLSLITDYRSYFLDQLWDMTQVPSQFWTTKTKNFERWESCCNVMDLMNNCIGIGPFKEKHKLTCTSEAVTIPLGFRNDIIDVHTKGKHSYLRFKSECLEFKPP